LARSERADFWQILSIPWTSNSRRGRFAPFPLINADKPRFAQLCATWGKDGVSEVSQQQLIPIDNMTKMEDWQVTVLLAAKKHVEAKDTEDGDYFA
jgi:hypothetical protein